VRLPCGFDSRERVLVRAANVRARSGASFAAVGSYAWLRKAKVVIGMCSGGCQVVGRLSFVTAVAFVGI